jgi:hypothetical protein
MRATFFGILSFVVVLAAADQVANHGRYTRDVVGYLKHSLR